jgi:type I restriction enzyme S subunit
MTWFTCRLGDVLTLKRGHDLPESQRREGDVPVVSSSGITGYHSEHRAKAPGVVTGRYGTIGEVFYIQEDYWPLNTSLYVVDFKGTKPRFAAYFLEYRLRNYQSDKAAVPGVNRNVLHEIKVRCPDEKVQERIADILSAYDELTENNQRRITLLDEAARQLFREWFVRLRFPGHERVKITNSLPEGWKRTALGGLCTLRAGSVFHPKYQGQNVGDMPFIKVRDLSSSNNQMAIVESDNWVSADECESFRGQPFPPGTVVFAKIGEGLRKNRVRFIVRETLIDNNLMGAVPTRVEESSLLYVHLAHYDFGANATGAAVPFLSAKALSQERFLVPSDPVLHQFNDIVGPVLQHCATLQKQSAEAARARDLLLPKLMSGEIAV